MRLALINQIDTLIQLVGLAENSYIYNLLVNNDCNVTLLRNKLLVLQAAETAVFSAVKSIDDAIDMDLVDEYNKAVMILANYQVGGTASLAGSAPNFRYSTSAGGWPSIPWRKDPDTTMYITDGPPSGTCGYAANYP